MHSPPEPGARPSGKAPGRFLKVVASLGGAALAGAYLLNPSAGIFEALPDNLPVLGNIDEVGATVLLLFCLGNLGIHILPAREKAGPVGGAQEPPADRAGGGNPRS